MHPSPNNSGSRVRNELFDRNKGFSRGRSTVVFVLWYLVKCAFFLSALPWPSALKAALLRLFGATIGRNVLIKPRVNVHFPWKLSIGENTWVGEEVNIINFETVAIGANCCISQRAFLCAGNHNFRSPDMAYRNAPIAVEDGVWIGAGCFVAPGVTLGIDCVVTAYSAAMQSMPPGIVCSGNPCRPLKPRWGDTFEKT